MQYVLETSILKRNVCFMLRRFPLKDVALMRKWLIQIRMEDFVPSTKSIICSNHFEKSCFYRRGRILLKTDAVPTIFLPESREGTSFYFYFRN